MDPFYLAIEGVIGVGKTTLARLLQARFGAELLLEAFEENPFLSDFYADRARYAFQTQMFFLLSRYRQQQVAAALIDRAPLIADYTFGKDRLFAHMTLCGDELDIYRQLYEVLADRVRQPDLVIYLRADVDLLMFRIAMRDRPYERAMERAYIADLCRAYDEYFTAYTLTPLLTIDAAPFDYVHDPAALAFIEGQIRTALGIGSYQRPLPQLGPAAAPLHALPSPGSADVAERADILGEFLRANEALGRLGALLANRPSGKAGAESSAQPAALRSAIHETMERLHSLARAVGVEAG